MLVKSSSLPLTLVIWGSGFALAGEILPLEEKWFWLASTIFRASLVCAIVLIFERIFSYLLDSFSQKTTQAYLSAPLVKGIFRGTILGLGALVFLEMIGISMTPVLASLGIGSLAVALGLQPTLANVFGGLQITLDKSIRIGDFVKLSSGEEGYVVEIGWRSTRVQLLPGNTVVIPNNQIMQSIVINYYLPNKEMAVLVSVGVHYDSNLEHVERVTQEVAKHVLSTAKGGVADFEPFIRFHTFGNSSIDFTVILRVQEFTDQYLVKHEFIKALHKRYKEEGIVIPFPIRTLEIPQKTMDALKEK